MHELEGQVGSQVAADSTAVELDAHGVGHDDTAGVVDVPASGHDGGGGQVGVRVLEGEIQGVNRSGKAKVGGNNKKDDCKPEESSQRCIFTFSLPSRAMPDLLLLEEARGVRLKTF